MVNQSVIVLSHHFVSSPSYCAIFGINKVLFKIINICNADLSPPYNFFLWYYSEEHHAQIVHNILQ